MNDESCRFVDDHQLVVFILHVERHLLGHDGGVEMRSCEAKGYDVARPHFVVALYGLVVDEEEASFGSLLYAVAAGVLGVFGEVFVNAQGHLTAVYFDAQMLVKLAVALGGRRVVAVQQLSQLFVFEQFVVFFVRFHAHSLEIFQLARVYRHEVILGTVFLVNHRQSVAVI